MKRRNASAALHDGLFQPYEARQSEATSTLSATPGVNSAPDVNAYAHLPLGILLSAGRELGNDLEASSFAYWKRWCARGVGSLMVGLVIPAGLVEATGIGPLFLTAIPLLVPFGVFVATLEPNSKLRPRSLRAKQQAFNASLHALRERLKQEVGADLSLEGVENLLGGVTVTAADGRNFRFAAGSEPKLLEVFTTTREVC